MNPPCTIIVEAYLPAIRRALARILVIEQGLPQSRAAELMGITQAMVSKYVTTDGKRLPERQQRHIDTLARDLSGVLEDPGEATRMLCSSCLAFRESGRLCRMHKEAGADASCDACMNLGRKNNPRNMVLHNLEQAVGMLIRANIAPLIPQVRSNIAMCTPAPSGPEDVASIPGRLIIVRNKAYSPTAPEFNASHHTTQLLLRLNGMCSSIRSIINIRADRHVREACGNAGLFAIEAVREHGDLVIEGLSDGVDCIHDPGDFGIEPCIYIVGQDAACVAKKAIAVHSLLKP